MAEGGPKAGAAPLPDAHRLGRIQEFLKQIVYGGNDGIITTFAVVSGFAGAQAAGVEGVAVIAVLVFGLANLFADATSMGFGEFLSTRSQRALYFAQHRQVMQRHQTNPAALTAEMQALLAARGMDLDDAARTADLLARHPRTLADLFLQLGQGMPEPGTESGTAKGVVTFASFCLFGVIPLAPYLLLAPGPGLFVLAIAATALALAALGLLRWHATRQSLLRCLGETLLVGAICALVAYGVGSMFR